MFAFFNKKTEDEDGRVPRFTGGEQHIGDPNDKTLRHVERENSINKIVQSRTKNEKCYAEIIRFHECIGHNQDWFGSKFMFRCYDARDAMNYCLVRWYWDPEFVNECTEMYLDQRSHYRRTGTYEGYEPPSHLKVKKNG